MTINEIKTALETPGIVFKAPNQRGDMIELKTLQEIKFENDELIYTGNVNGIGTTDPIMAHQMNINKFGPTCVTLYTFDMMGKKTVAKIKYADVEIVGRMDNTGHKIVY
jgi:hypothetical protein